MAFIRLYLLKKIFDFDVRQFIEISFIKIGLISIPLLIFYILYNPASFPIWGHILGIILSEIFLVAVIVLIGLDKEERQLLASFVK